VVYRQLGKLRKLPVFRTGYHGGENWIADADQQWDVHFLDTSTAAEASIEGADIENLKRNSL